MATLVIKHAGNSKTIDDPDFADPGDGTLKVGNDAALQYVNWLGDAWEAPTIVTVGGKTYEGCVIDLQPEAANLSYTGMHSD